MKIFFILLVNALSTIIIGTWNRKKENTQDTKLFIALMIGGFFWSQLQTEYLIWRIKKNTDQSLNKHS